MQPKVILISLALGMGAVAPGHPATPPLHGQARVVDGDTLTVAGVKVRLSGMDAPETDQVCLDPAGSMQPCGIASRDGLTRLIGSAAVTCEPSGQDVYHRTLASCRSASGQDLQEAMVAQGLALSFRRYSHQYDAAEERARESGRGLWAGAFVAPWDWRHRTPRTIILGRASVPLSARCTLLPHGSGECTGSKPDGNTPVAGCVIKGNINRAGERIYHMPGQSHYDDVRIRPGDGKRLFCTEDEAQAAGWRRALR